MKFLLDQLDAIAPLFHKGGKLEKLYPIYEAGDTFLFSPADVTDGKTHVRDAIDLKRVMITVVLALLPCLIFGIFNAGNQYLNVNQVSPVDLQFFNLLPGIGKLPPGLLHLAASMFQGSLIVLPIVLMSYTIGGLWEVLFCVIRKHEINEGFLVTGLLFPLTLPPTIPLWQVAVGVSFGVVIGKEIFGGTGFNILNPALTARAFLFFAYPKDIIGDEVWTMVESGQATLAGWTGATPLAVATLAPVGDGATVIASLAEKGYNFQNMLIGLEGGSIGETSLIPIMLGLAILMLTGLASMRIIAGGVIGLIIGGLLMNFTHLLTSDTSSSFLALPFYYHFVMGSFMFGIVFMATDPVSAAATNRGKWIYGGLIGFLTVIIRVVNPAYPEGVMLSILLMNVMAPLVDWFAVESHLKKRAARIRNFSYAN